jgi:prepilin-type processing-associated H-X9-DG protein
MPPCFPDKPRTAFGINSSRRLREFADGTSKTLVFAEVLTNQALRRDCATTPTGLSSSLIVSPTSYPDTGANPADISDYLTGPCAESNVHTQWFDGAVRQTGVTTAWTPNHKSLGLWNGSLVDVDLGGWRESSAQKGGLFWGMTSRSSHSGGVNVLMADGSARLVGNSIDGAIWRAAATLNGGETTPSL